MFTDRIGRIQAFLIHLGISLGIFGVLLALIVLVWYPQPFFATDGGWQGIRLIAGVDIVLGPLLTLIVFKKGKPSLKMDLTIIALIQLSALSAGTWIVYNERPVAVVFSDDRMIPIPHYQLREAGMSMSELKSFGSVTPVPIITELPSDPLAVGKLYEQARASGQPLYLSGDLYRPLNMDFFSTLAAASVNLDEYIKGRTAQEQQVYREFMANNPDARDKYLFIPLHSRLQTFITVLSRQDLSFVTSLSITPPTDYFAQGKIVIKRPQAQQQGQGGQGSDSGPATTTAAPAAD